MLGLNIYDWLVIFIYFVVIISTLLATGKIIFRDYLIGFMALSLGILSAVVIYYNMKKQAASGNYDK